MTNHPSPSGPGAPMSAEFTSEEFEAEALLLDGHAEDLRQRYGGDTIPSLSASGRAKMLRYAASLRAALAAARHGQAQAEVERDEADARTMQAMESHSATLKVLENLVDNARMSFAHTPYRHALEAAKKVLNR